MNSIDLMRPRVCPTWRSVKLGVGLELDHSLPLYVFSASFVQLKYCNPGPLVWVATAQLAQYFRDENIYVSEVLSINRSIFLKKWDNPIFFVYFRSFQIQFVQNNCRRQRDSNSDRRSRRRARWPLDHHHGYNRSIFVSASCTHGYNRFDVRTLSKKIKLLINWFIIQQLVES